MISGWRLERLLAVQGTGLLIAAAPLILIAAYEGQGPAC